MEYLTFRPKLEHLDPAHVNLGDIMSRLDFEYWASDTWLEPENHLDDLLEELDDEHFMAAAKILYQTIVRLPGCQPNSMQFDEIMQDEVGGVQEVEACKSEFYEWYHNAYGDIGDLYDDESQDGNGLIRHLYQLWLERSLNNSGKSRAETESAFEVIALEAFRRRLGNYTMRRFYAEARAEGLSHDQVVENRLPLHLKQTVMSQLEFQYQEGETVLNPAQMTESEIEEAVRRYINDNRDDYAILEATYLLDTKGVLPHYYFCTS